MSYIDDELKKRNRKVPEDMIKIAEKMGLGKDLPGLDGLDPFEVFNSFWGNDTPTKAEKNAMGILRKPLSFTRSLMRGVEPGSRRSGFQAKTITMIHKANKFISQYDMPLTVRQVYYRFVGEGLIENSIKSYKSLAGVLANAREAGLIGYDKIVDRTRRAIKPNSWTSPKSFFETVKNAYNRKLLDDQEKYVEVWVEKDALAGVFEPITGRFDVYLVVGRGYPSHSALYEASKRITEANKPAHILYYGDFDPSGEDIYRDIQDRLRKLFSIDATFEKVALTAEDITTYNLPPAPAKRSDTRSREFIASHGDMAVELDALPPDVLTDRIKKSVISQTDMDKFERQIAQYKQDQLEIERTVEGFT